MGQGEGQLPKGVADGADALAHVDPGGGADHHGLEHGLARVYLQHGDIVVHVAAHHGGVIGGAVVEGDLDAGRAGDGPH